MPAGSCFKALSAHADLVFLLPPARLDGMVERMPMFEVLIVKLDPRPPNFIQEFSVYSYILSILIPLFFNRISVQKCLCCPWFGGPWLHESSNSFIFWLCYCYFYVFRRPLETPRVAPATNCFQGWGAGQILDPAPLPLRLQQFFKIRLHSGSGSRQVEIFILIACGVSNKRSQKGEYIFSISFSLPLI